MLENNANENLGQLVEIPLTLDQQQKLPDLVQTVRTFLKGNMIYKKSNIYRFIPSGNKSGDILKAKGTDHPEFESIYAFAHTRIFTKDSLLPIEYLFNYGEEGCPYTCMIAVYDGMQFINDEEHHFNFKNPEDKLHALKAVIYVQPRGNF